MTKVSVVVPTYRRPTILRQTLEQLVALDHPPGDLEVIVVDDADDAVTATVIDDLTSGPARVQLLRQRRRGAAAARNAGARQATGEVLLFCDDDMLVAPDHLSRHLETRARFGDVIVGGNRWYSPDSAQALGATPFGRFRMDLERGFQARIDAVPVDDGYVEAVTLPSCDLSIARAAFWGLGGFDEEFPYAGAEDQDFCLRAVAAGYRLIRNLSIRPLHNESTISLRQFCEREERGAHTVVVLSRKHPETLGDFAANGPITRTDPLPLLVKKLAKSFLALPPVLAAVHYGVELLERLGVAESTLRVTYRMVIGIHLFRGYRNGLRVDATPG